MTATTQPGSARAAERSVALMYHRLGSSANEWERKLTVSAAGFAAQMHALADRGFRACAIDAYVGWLKGQCQLPEESFLLTFDDGFVGVHEHGLPVLRELGWPFTVFVVSGLIGGRDQWTADLNPAGTTQPLLGKREIEEMVLAGASIQSHSRLHPDLRTLSDAALAEELAGARGDLEALVGGPVRYLAYPYGGHDERVIRAAQAAGYDAAFTVESGFNRPGADLFRIRRLDVFGTDSESQFMRKFTLGTNDGSLRAGLRYYLSRLNA